MKGVKKLWVANCRKCGARYDRATRNNKLCEKCREEAYKERGFYLALIKYGDKKNDKK